MSDIPPILIRRDDESHIEYIRRILSIPRSEWIEAMRNILNSYDLYTIHGYSMLYDILPVDMFIEAQDSCDGLVVGDRKYEEYRRLNRDGISPCIPLISSDILGDLLWYSDSGLKSVLKYPITTMTLRYLLEIVGEPFKDEFELRMINMVDQIMTILSNAEDWDTDNYDGVRVYSRRYKHGNIEYAVVSLQSTVYTREEYYDEGLYHDLITEGYDEDDAYEEATSYEESEWAYALIGISVNGMMYSLEAVRDLDESHVYFKIGNRLISMSGRRWEPALQELYRQMVDGCSIINSVVLSI